MHGARRHQHSQWRACAGLRHRQSGLSHDMADIGLKGLTVRGDIINLGDTNYQIRSGSGVGVFAPQLGARRDSSSAFPRLSDGGRLRASPGATSIRGGGDGQASGDREIWARPARAQRENDTQINWSKPSKSRTASGNIPNFVCTPTWISWDFCQFENRAIGEGTSLRGAAAR